MVAAAVAVRRRSGGGSSSVKVSVKETSLLRDACASRTRMLARASAVPSRPTRSFSSICFRTRPVSAMSGFRLFATSARDATRSAGDTDGAGGGEEEGAVEVTHAAARRRAAQPNRGHLDLIFFLSQPTRVAGGGRRRD